MWRKPRQPAEHPPRRRELRERLVPGGGQAVYRDCTGPAVDEASRRRRDVYSLLSSISAAMRDLAEDQNRSAERSDTPSASAVSAVVRPAK